MNKEATAIIMMLITTEGYIDDLTIDEGIEETIDDNHEIEEEMKTFVDNNRDELYDTKVAVVVKEEIFDNEYNLKIIDYYILDREISRYYNSEEDNFNDIDHYFIDPIDHS